MITFEREISQTRDGALVRRGALGVYSIQLDLSEQVLRAELSFMERLFLGACVTVMRELGIDPGATDWETVAAATCAHWARSCGEDRDLAQDARTMLPLFFDIERRKTRVWLFL
jgi:hypothetical protein